MGCPYTSIEWTSCQITIITSSDEIRFGRWRRAVRWLHENVLHTDTKFRDQNIHVHPYHPIIMRQTLQENWNFEPWGWMDEMCIGIKEGSIALLGENTGIHSQIVRMKSTVIQAILVYMVQYDITVNFLLLDIIQTSRFIQTRNQCFVLLKWTERWYYWNSWNAKDRPNKKNDQIRVHNWLVTDRMTEETHNKHKFKGRFSLRPADWQMEGQLLQGWSSSRKHDLPGIDNIFGYGSNGHVTQ